MFDPISLNAHYRKENRLNKAKRGRKTETLKNKNKMLEPKTRQKKSWSQGKKGKKAGGEERMTTPNAGHSR